MQPKLLLHGWYRAEQQDFVAPSSLALACRQHVDELMMGVFIALSFLMHTERLALCVCSTALQPQLSAMPVGPPWHGASLAGMLGCSAGPWAASGAASGLGRQLLSRV